MPANDAQFQILRAAVQLRIDRTSAKAVAREAGVSAGTIYSFVAARVRPYGTTLARLETWFRNLVLAGRREGAVFAVEPFLISVPDEERSAAADELVAALREIHTRRGLAWPLWLLDNAPWPRDGKQP